MHLRVCAATLLIMLALVPATARDWPGIADSLQSKVLGETRRFQVLLPAGYATSNKKYEVLYMPDGEWYMEQIPYIYNFVVGADLAPANIIVLIPNLYAEGVNMRDRDYSPVVIPDAKRSGGADNYHRFLKEELIPKIESTYRTNGQRTLVGSSFSGLFAVYAFFKEPDLFNSFIASDPNLFYGNDHVLRMAAEKLPSFKDVTSSLFFAGLDVSSNVMHSHQLDSLLRASDGPALRWKYIEYKDETHYSVQHKAFYDGIRYAHHGYSKIPTSLHPMNGILEPGKPLTMASLNDRTPIYYTVDGQTPTSSSLKFESGETVVNGPCMIKATTFAQRESDRQFIECNFSEGRIPVRGKSRNARPLKLSVFQGTWRDIPDVSNIKPARSGDVDKQKISKGLISADEVYIIDGDLEIPVAGYYIFVSDANDRTRVTLGGQSLFDLTRPGSTGPNSFVVPLKKGHYPLRAELVRNSKSPDVNFSVHRPTPDNPKWWLNELISF